MELHQSFLMKVMFTFFLITIITVFVIALIQMGEKNDYQQYANLQIERHGGLTTEAVTIINQYSEDNYNGRFVITTTPSEKVPIFENVIYTYTMNIQPLIFDWDILTFNFEGQATSLVR